MKIDKSWYTKPLDPNFPSAVSAGGLVVRKEGDKLMAALLRDKKYTKYMLPKGKVEDGEEFTTAAAREIEEEIGLSELQFVSELGMKERLTLEKSEWRKTYYYLFLTNQIEGGQELQEGEEDYIMEWFDLESIPDFFWPEQKEIVEKNKEKIKSLLSKKSIN